MRYCVYLTIYDGNKLPPFYIGFSTIDNVFSGYHGTVSSRRFRDIWKRELENNPNLFRTIIISEHETMQSAKARETEIQQKLKVDTNDLYVNSFIQGSKFCFNQTGFKHSEETKAKMRESRKGKTPVPKGSSISEEHKGKIGRALTGRKRSKESVMRGANSRRGKKNTKPFSEEAKKNIALATKAAMTPEVRFKISESTRGEKNGFYGKKHTEETRAKLSLVDRSYISNSFWWTNGTECKRCTDCPGEGWVKGRKLKGSRVAGSSA